MGLPPGSHLKRHLLHRLRSFGSLTTKGLDQVRLLVDSKKLVLNFYVVFGNLELVAKIVS